MSSSQGLGNLYNNLMKNSLIEFYLSEVSSKDSSSKSSHHSSGISSPKSELLQTVAQAILPKSGKLEKLDQPLLTDRMEQFIIQDENDVNQFLGDVEKRLPEFNGIHWGEFAKKIHSIDDKLLALFKERVQKIALSIFDCKDLTPGQVAQLTGSIFPLCGDDKTLFQKFSVLFSKYVDKFNLKECVMALKGIQKVSNTYSFVFDILNHAKQECKKDAAGSIFLTSAQQKKFSLKALLKLFPNQFVDLHPQEQLNFLKGILLFAKKEVFFQNPMPYVNLQHFQRLNQEPVLKDIAERILLGLEVALQYGYMTMQWENLFLKHETKFSPDQKIAFFEIMSSRKKELSSELKNSYSQLHYSLKSEKKEPAEEE